MRYIVNLVGDASNYLGKYVTLIFLNGKFEGEITRPDVLKYLKSAGHTVRPAEESTSAPTKKTSKKKEA